MIVTSNLKDFPKRALSPWNLQARHPDDFLVELYAVNPQAVMRRLHDQAATISRSLPDLLTTLSVGVPKFATIVGKEALQ